MSSTHGKIANPNPLPHRKGFTLIEMLVVIGIIAVLAAIIFPVFAGVKAAAKRSSCASNLHQIGLALSLYLQDSSGTYPFGTDGVTVPLSWTKGVKLVDQMKMYIKGNRIWDCPADIGFNISSLGFGPPSAHPTAFQTFGTSYIYLLSGFGSVGPAFTEGMIVKPAEEGLMFDMDGAWHTRQPQVPAGAGVDQWDMAQESYWYNVLFFDNHVKYLPDAEMRYSEDPQGPQP